MALYNMWAHAACFWISELFHPIMFAMPFQPPLSVVWLFQHSVLVLLHLLKSCPTRLK